MTRVLVVDDDFAVTEMTRLVLQHEGFTVDVAANGADALDLVERAPPDVIVTDFMMPILDGARMVRALRRTPGSRGIPVILITASASREITDADQYACVLVKPVTLGELLAAIRQVLG